jgi:cell division protein FtsB
MALAGFILAIRNDLVQNSALNDEKEAMKKSLREETSRQAVLKNKLRIMNKNSYVELVAREKLGLIQRGEDPYKVTIK